MTRRTGATDGDGCDKRSWDRVIKEPEKPAAVAGKHVTDAPFPWRQFRL